MFKKLYAYAAHQEPLAVAGGLSVVADFVAENGASWRQLGVAVVVWVARHFVSPAQAKTVSTVVDAVAPELPADPRIAALEAEVKSIATRIGG